MKKSILAFVLCAMLGTTITPAFVIAADERQPTSLFKNPNITQSLLQNITPFRQILGFYARRLQTKWTHPIVSVFILLPIFGLFTSFEESCKTKLVNRTSDHIKTGFNALLEKYPSLVRLMYLLKRLESKVRQTSRRLMSACTPSKVSTAYDSFAITPRGQQITGQIKPLLAFLLLTGCMRTLIGSLRRGYPLSVRTFKSAITSYLSDSLYTIGLQKIITMLTGTQDATEQSVAQQERLWKHFAIKHFAERQGTDINTPDFQEMLAIFSDDELSARITELEGNPENEITELREVFFRRMKTIRYALSRGIITDEQLPIFVSNLERKDLRVLREWTSKMEPSTWCYMKKYMLTASLGSIADEARVSLVEWYTGT